ncbi:MAG: cation:proton antiporter [Rhodobacteraceae bacterium]|nr:cation:proton antiporter [Paracoccaceae bacterium]
MESFLLQATIYLCAAVIAVPVAHRLGFGSVLGYLMAGVLIGPVLGLVGGYGEMADLQHFAEFGVVMMLFIIGLELDPRGLWEMRHKLIGLGGFQIVISTGLIAAVFMTLGQPWPIALAVGMTLALSSTAIVIQTLNEKNLMTTNGGRSAFSVLLSQDIAVIPMLAFVPLLAIRGVHNFSDHGDDGHGHGVSLVAGLPGWGAMLVTLGAIVLVVGIGVYLTRPVFHFIARSRLPEMFTAVALLLVVGIALLMMSVGLSPALGTFLAGVVLANSEFRHQLESDIEPFKGLLLGLFFITVGAGINFELLGAKPTSLLLIVVAVMGIKAAVLYGLAVVFNLRDRDRWLFTLSLAQAGEFGFVMLSTTVATNVIPTALSQELALVVAISMLLTPLLFIAYDQIHKRMTTQGERPEEDRINAGENGAIIVVGIGRFGQIINRMALACGLKTVVIDHHIEQINAMRRFGVKGYFGDPTRPDLMHSAGLMAAKILVVAVDDRAAAVKLVAHARKERPDLHIIARAYDRNHVYQLYRAGATDIVRETFDSALRGARYMLQAMGWSEYDAFAARDAFFKADRHALLELASVWDPNVPNVQNEAYVELARQINKDLHTGFLSNLSQVIDETEDTPEKIIAE